MTFLRTLTTTTALLAMTATSLPADAQSRRGPQRHHHDDKIDAGDVALGAVLAGGLIALLASGRKKSAPPPETVTYLDDAGEAPDPNAPPRDTVRDEEAAIEACVSAAEIEGKRLAHISKIESVGTVVTEGTGYDIRGILTLRDTYRDPTPRRRGFTCTASDHGVEHVAFDGERVALNP